MLDKVLERTAAPAVMRERPYDPEVEIKTRLTGLIEMPPQLFKSEEASR